MILFTVHDPSVQSAEPDDDPDFDPDDDPLLTLALSDPAPGVPPGTAGAGTRTPAGPAVRPRFVSTATAAVILGVAIDTIRKMIRDGRLQARKWGSSPQAKWRVPVEALDRLGDAPPPENLP